MNESDSDSVTILTASLLKPQNRWNEERILTILGLIFWAVVIAGFGAFIARIVHSNNNCSTETSIAPYFNAASRSVAHTLAVREGRARCSLRPGSRSKYIVTIPQVKTLIGDRVEKICPCCGSIDDEMLVLLGAEGGVFRFNEDKTKAGANFVVNPLICLRDAQNGIITLLTIIGLLLLCCLALSPFLAPFVDPYHRLGPAVDFVSKLITSTPNTTYYADLLAEDFIDSLGIDPTSWDARFVRSVLWRRLPREITRKMPRVLAASVTNNGKSRMTLTYVVGPASSQPSSASPRRPSATNNNRVIDFSSPVFLPVFEQ